VRYRGASAHVKVASQRLIQVPQRANTDDALQPITVDLYTVTVIETDDKNDVGIETMPSVRSRRGSVTLP